MGFLTKRTALHENVSSPLEDRSWQEAVEGTPSLCASVGCPCDPSQSRECLLQDSPVPGAEQTMQQEVRQALGLEDLN